MEYIYQSKTILRLCKFVLVLELITWMMVYVYASDQVSHERHGSEASQQNKGYMVHTVELTLQPSYEYPVNPFLSHVEQAFKLKPKPTRKHYRSRHFAKVSTKNVLNGIDKVGGFKSSYGDPVELQPEEDPTKPHFVDDNDYVNANDGEIKAFGDEEKNFSEMINVLFSSDY
ncbi:hypothetical protein Ocin01_06402 [Orchesella cincta]|uniref:Uncharacterized protein n=1 Tax=Orchesella cincta TaxID=48709 RepID=A0A1D2N4T6_ORCCI|nr:hypothetical protein Ocin01_06402 [Orchesella cincta]